MTGSTRIGRMRDGAQYFTEPASSAQRRYEALRAYFLDEMPAAEIAAACTSEGLPVSAQTCWQILDAEGLPRLPRRDDGRRGPPARLDPVKAAALPGWPGGPLDLPCDHAGLLLLFTAIPDTPLAGLLRPV